MAAFYGHQDTSSECSENNDEEKSEGFFRKLIGKIKKRLTVPVENGKNVSENAAIDENVENNEDSGSSFEYKGFSCEAASQLENLLFVKFKEEVEELVIEEDVIDAASPDDNETCTFINGSPAFVKNKKL